MKKNHFIVILIPLISLIIGILTIGHYGINWDEPFHYRRGQAFLHYFLTGNKTYSGIPKYPPLKGTSDSGDFRNSDKLFKEVQDNPTLSDPNFRRSYYQDDAWNGEYFIDKAGSYGHPALNDILASLSNYIFYQKLGLLGDIESYHLFIVFIVSATTLSIAVFMWKQYGITQSVISSLAFASYPLLLGEQHFNIKDPVETSFYTMSILSIFLGITKKKPFFLALGILSTGAALATKFNIVFAAIPLFTWLYFHLKGKKPKGRFKFSKTFYVLILLAPFIIFGVLVVSFPTIWTNPVLGITNLLKFYKEVGSSFSQPPNYYLFKFINYYPSLWILLTTPPATLILFLCSFIFVKKFNEKNYLPLLLLLWFVTAVARISFGGALSYGGVRLIMEYIPPMAMLSGISAGHIIEAFKKGKTFVLLLIVLAFFPAIVKLVNIHPNENVYFNFLIGGLKGAKEKNINAWGNSNGNAYYPAVLWLNQNAPDNAKLTVPVNLIGNIPRFKLRPDISLSYQYWSGPAHLGEYAVELTYDYPPMQWYSLKYLNTVMKPVHEVLVDGVAIAKVWKNNPEFVYENFRQQETLDVNLKADQKTKRLSLALPETQKIMQVSIFQPTENCSPLKTGYVMTSIDGENWTREPEDIAQDQLKQSRPRIVSPVFDYYFVARESKYIIFEADSKDSCLLKATLAKVIVNKF